MSQAQTLGSPELHRDESQRDFLLATMAGAYSILTCHPPLEQLSVVSADQGEVSDVSDERAC